MANGLNIASLEDLRKLSFSTLFYRICGNSHGITVTRKIVATINPNFIRQYQSQREEVLLLNYLKNEIKLQRIKHEIYLESLRRKLQPLFSSNGSAYYPPKREEVIPTDVTSLLSPNGFLDLILKDKQDSESSSGAWLNSLQLDRIRIALFSDEEVYKEVLSEIETRLVSALQGEDRILSCLLSIPLLKSDQDLIIFFGRNYHVAFDEVDAYYGLLYASDYFCSDGLHLCLDALDASDDEIQKLIDKRRKSNEIS